MPQRLTGWLQKRPREKRKRQSSIGNGPKLEVSELSKIRHGFKASLIFFGIAFIIYITVILTLSIVKTDFPFLNGALIIYASVYFIAFLIYFALTKLWE